MSNNPQSAIANLQLNEPLARHTSWRIGGPARYYLEAASADELRAARRWAAARDLPVFLLGGGTNLLVRDSGFPGLVLRYTARAWEIKSLAIERLTPGRDETQSAMAPDTALLYVEAGAPMAGTVRRVCARGWGGLEWAEGLPGTVGGAVFGNAGCYGGDIAGVLARAWLLAGEDIEEWPAARFAYGYRTSVLKIADRRLQIADCDQRETPSAIRNLQSPIILAAELRVQRADPAALAATMARIAAERKGKTPWGSSCGSVFKNPPGNSAGRLIEQAGLKGARAGQAEISERHANYIVNRGGASSDDVLRLIEQARGEVLRQFGVELELEVQILG